MGRLTIKNATRILALFSPLLAAQQTGAQEAGGDPAAGETLFARCAGCHALDTPRIGAGPHLVGLIGREAGSVEGFRYSPALADSDIVWDEDSLRAYILDAREVVPGTRKAGVLTDSQDVADVFAYLLEGG